MNSKANKMIVTGLGLCLGWVSCAFSQVAEIAAAEGVETNVYGMSIRQAWEYGGWIMWILAAVSIFALALVLYFITALRSGAIVPRELISDILARIRSNDLNEARRLSDRHPCPFAAIVLSSLDCMRNVPECDVHLLRSAAEAEGARQAESIQGQTQLLLDVATIAPLLGLLGTVLGMLKAFSSVASDVASAKPVVLAAGVSQAIVTTIFGLIVAIPCMAFYAWFRRRASRQISNLEAATSEVMISIIGMNSQMDISEKEEEA
ncbi:MAG: MotA/TolQ/ExbB proton channel family protein [Kiritimatiellae bacterium]|jgi:biopolymer transport protein ExbB|nr:MotA/TolQ/ExbB proton channel family protein [Kiritimatiellia bacterium]